MEEKPGLYRLGRVDNTVPALVTRDHSGRVLVHWIGDDGHLMTDTPFQLARENKILVPHAE